MKVVYGIMHKAIELGAHKEDYPEDVLHEVLDMYVAGLTLEELCKLFSTLKEDYKGYVFDYQYSIKKFSDVLRVLRGIVFEILEQEVLSTREWDQIANGEIPSLPSADIEFKDSELQVFISVKGFDLLKIVKQVFTNYIDLDDSVKIPTSRDTAIVIQKLGEEKYRIYTQGTDIDIRDFFNKVARSIRDANYSLDPRDYIGGKPKRKWTYEEKEDLLKRIILLNNKLVKEARA